MALRTPEPARVPKSNFAYSQSPPSHSPIRRFGNERQFSPESEAGQNVRSVRAILEAEEPMFGNGPISDDDEEEEPEGDDDGQASEGQAQQGAWGSGGVSRIPGIQVLQGQGGGGQESDGEEAEEEEPAVAAKEEQEEEDEEGEEEEENGDSVMPDSAQERRADHSVAPQVPATHQEEGSEEEEEADEGGPMEEESQPGVAAQPIMGEVPGDSAGAEEDLTSHQIVMGPSKSEVWTSLPPEADDEWTVTQDVCSLTVAGAEMKLPRTVYDRLYGYQRQGVTWMWNLFRKELGGILADEMGLGKTVQVAAFLASLVATEQGTRFLVAVPVTLIEQWRRELSTWAQDTGLKVHVLHGTLQERRSALRGVVVKGGVLLTSYDMLRNHISYLRTASLTSAASLLPKKRKRQKRSCRDDDSPSEEEDLAPVLPPQAAEEGPERLWDVCIVDEAHQLKNPSCMFGRELRRVRSRSRFLLTGTPLQNKLSDLWSLMDFAQPGLLGNHATFERTFSEQIAKGLKRNATRFAVELKDHLSRELKRLTAPHFLRRLKTEVMQNSDVDSGNAPSELPQKTDVVLWLKLTEAQLELYDVYLGSETVKNATGGRCGLEALKAIAVLKKLTNHPLLCLPPDEFNDWRQRVAPPAGGAAASRQSGQMQQPAAASAETEGPDEDMTQAAPECQQVLPRVRALVPSSVEGAALLSCKLRVLSVLLPQLEKRGHRCLIFSQSTRMLDLVQACVLRVLGLKFLRIDGSIEAKDRDLKVNKFQQPDSRYFCMCMSVQVGGVGLTITGADRVILVDPAWNPAMDAQAIDRVHRIGQQREVVVYRLVGAAAIEDKMFRLQVFKRALAKSALEHEQQLRFFTHKQLKQLFEPPSKSVSTQDLMAEQLGTEALEHEGLLQVVAGDIGSTDDPQAIPFWQSSDVLGFSDYTRLFMYLEQAQPEEDGDDAESKAKYFTEKLTSEEYAKDQVVDGKWRAKWRDGQSKENLSPQDAPVPLQDAA